jgi:magnesium-transporting ATPase (P-type)
MIKDQIEFVDKLSGLSEDQVKHQLEKFGYNELPVASKKNIIQLFC